MDADAKATAATALPVATLVNARTGKVISNSMELAVTRASRRQGLLGRTGLDASEALLIAPCFGVHTAFMKFAIDVVFIDGDGNVRKVVNALPPWRMSASPGAYATIEFAAGAAQAHRIAVGSRLYIQAAPGDDRARVLGSLMAVMLPREVARLRHLKAKAAAIAAASS